MSRRARRNQAAAFKAKVVLETAREEQTLTQLAQRLDLYPNQITQWKNQLLDRATEVLAKSSKPVDLPIDVKTLQAKKSKIGDRSTTGGKIDQLHTARPFAVSRMLPDMLRLDGEKVGRKQVSTRMKKMGIEAF